MIENRVSRCRAGDGQAWAEVVDSHAGLVNGILRGAFRLAARDAEDAFQEVGIHRPVPEPRRAARGLAELTR